MLRAFVPILLAGVAALVQTAAPTDAWSKVAGLYRQRLQQAGIVGSSLVYVRSGNIAHQAFEGLQDLDARRPVDENTIYHWASITKTFTGVAIMQLRDRGLLSLDDPVVRYVPELRQVHNPYGDIAQVTIRHLMSHSGGFRSGTWPWGGDQPWHPFEPTRWEQVVAMFPYTQILFKPGTEYRYSNPGVIFLGRIVEHFSGDDYEVYVNKNIFMPLGMTRSFFDRAPYHLVAHRSHSYVRTDEGLKEQRFDFDSGITVSNGGLNAPPADMAKWVAFLAGAGNDPSTSSGPPRAESRGDAVLKRSSIDEMFTPQIRARAGEGASGSDVQAGLSSFVERYGPVELVGHSGDQNGFISHIYVHRPTRSGYAVSFNTNTSSKRDPKRTTQAVDDDLRDAIVGALFLGR